MDIMARWRKAWGDAINPSFITQLIKDTFCTIKQLFVVIAAALFIIMGASMLSIPELLGQALDWLSSIKIMGSAIHFIVNIITRNFLMVFVLMVCAPKKQKDTFWYYLGRLLFFWVVTGFVLNYLSAYIPVAALKVIDVILEFSLFAWVYGKVAFHRSFAVGSKLVVGSLPLVALASGISIVLLNTQGFVLMYANKFVGWWGLIYIITTLYSLLRVAFFITLYHSQASHYLGKPKRKGAPRGRRPGSRPMTPARPRKKKKVAEKKD